VVGALFLGRERGVRERKRGDRTEGGEREREEIERGFDPPLSFPFSPLSFSHRRGPLPHITTHSSASLSPLKNTPNSPDHVQVFVINKTPLFFCERDGPWLPTLRLLHQYPDMMPKLRADKGAIKFVLSGAHIMCPGLTSAGATIHDEVGEEHPVAIYAEGNEHAMAVGVATLSTADIKSVNKGIGVENVHYLNDGLWKTPVFA